MTGMPEHDRPAAQECPVCGRAGALVAPSCDEGHGDECPDRICADCGVAVFLDPVVTAAQGATRRRATVRSA